MPGEPTVQTTNLPSFKNPPVIETVLGAQFAPLEDFSNAHLGMFWKCLRESDKQWTQITDVPALQQSFEPFGGENLWAVEGLRLHLTQNPASRLRIRNDSGSSMVQVQNGRFNYNWLGTKGTKYRRYTSVRPAFDETFELFINFLKAESLGTIQPNQWEVTYVNHMPKGSVWNNPEDWFALFPSLLGSAPTLPTGPLESFSTKWHFEIKPKHGRLHIDLEHGRESASETKEGKEMLKMTLTARGPVNGKCQLGQGLDLGRIAIVTAFKNLTSDAAHKIWEIENGDA